MAKTLRPITNLAAKDHKQIMTLCLTLQQDLFLDMGIPISMESSPRKAFVLRVWVIDKETDHRLKLPSGKSFKVIEIKRIT